MQQGMQSGNQNYGNQQYGNQQYGGQQYGNQQYGGQQYGNQQYGGQQYGNQQYGGQQYGNQQYGGQQYGNQQYGGQQYGNQQYGNQQYGNNQGMQENGWLGFCWATCLSLGCIAGYVPLVTIEHSPLLIPWVRRHGQAVWRISDNNLITHGKFKWWWGFTRLPIMILLDLAL